MHSQHCPHCEFIYIGKDGPGEECPECGGTWSLRILNDPAVLFDPSNSEGDGGEETRSRWNRSLWSGLALGGIAGLLAGILGLRRISPIEDTLEYRNVSTHAMRAEEQLELALVELQTANKQLTDRDRELQAASQELQIQREEVQSLQDQNESSRIELARVASRLEEAEAELLAARRAASQSSVRDWLLLGPLASPGGEARFPRPIPIRPDASVSGLEGRVNWRPYTSDENRINLARFFDYRNKAVCLAASWVHSDSDREVTLNLGSDDGICVWINGLKVHEHATNRAASPGQDRTDARLRSGWNELVVAVDNAGSGDWDLYFEFLTVENARPLRLYSTNTPPDPQ